MNFHSPRPTIIEVREEIPAVDQMLSDLCSASVALEDLTRTKEGCDQVINDFVHFSAAMLNLALVFNRLKGASA